MNDQRRHHNGRPRTRAEERIEALEHEQRARRGHGPPRGPEARPEAEQRVAELEAELAETKAAWQRTAADYANYRRRTEQEREATLGLANESLLRKLLAVVDDFDRALEAMPKELEHAGWAEGVWLVERKLRQLLESEGVTPIDAAGKRFDPREHEAVVHQETADAPDETVIGELQKGYRIRDRVLRPALVAVAKNVGDGSGRGAGNDDAGARHSDSTTDNDTQDNTGQPAVTGEGQ